MSRENAGLGRGPSSGLGSLPVLRTGALVRLAIRARPELAKVPYPPDKAQAFRSNSRALVPRIASLPAARSLNRPEDGPRPRPAHNDYQYEPFLLLESGGMWLFGLLSRREGLEGGEVGVLIVALNS
ncbi:hypothetical protein CLH39_18720 [Alcaligenes faecalis]|nr:hypothetical protein CLH39_18720 [Alcaligenes faecalis]